MTERLAAAAAARSAGVAQRTDRPRERRGQLNDGNFVALATAGLSADMELRDSSAGGLEFFGVATAYEVGYEMYDWYGPYTEIVTAGAGANSLNRADLDVPLVLNHDSLRRIATTSSGTLQLTERDTGLEVFAPSLDQTDLDVQYITPKLRSGLVREMSFMFRIIRGHWSPDYTEYRIDEYDIHRGDVAIVGFGANPHTSAELRSESAPKTSARALPEDFRALPLVRL